MFDPSKDSDAVVYVSPSADQETFTKVFVAAAVVGSGWAYDVRIVVADPA
jgi:hypothetical protein